MFGISYIWVIYYQINYHLFRCTSGFSKNIFLEKNFKNTFMYLLILTIYILRILIMSLG